MVDTFTAVNVGHVIQFFQSLLFAKNAVQEEEQKTFIKSTRNILPNSSKYYYV